jgi:hypothetical protein
MKTKKMLSDTVGVVIGGVGINEANKISPMGNVVGTAMGVGMVSQVMPKKKKGGMF